jgi:hypothetical protein
MGVRTGSARLLLQPVNDAGLVEVVGGHFHADAVADGEADEALAHLARDVRENLMFVGQFDAKHRSGEHRKYLSFNLDWLFH